MTLKTGDVCTFTIIGIASYIHNRLPPIGMRFRAGSSMLRIINIRLSELVLDAVVE